MSTFLPMASSPRTVEAPSAMISPAFTFWPGFTIGRWFWQVRSLRPANLRSTYSSALSMMMRSPSTNVTVPPRTAFTIMPEWLPTTRSMPVATQGASLLTSGTAWRCMFEPMRARLASSCSRKGISEALTPTICLGLMSTNWTSSGSTSTMSTSLDSSLPVRRRAKTFSILVLRTLATLPSTSTASDGASVCLSSSSARSLTILPDTLPPLTSR